MTNLALPLAKTLSRTAIVLALAVVGLLVLMELEVIPDSEAVIILSFLTGIIAPVFAVVGFGLAKLYRLETSRSAVLALVLGGIIVVWPIVFYLAFFNCPRGYC